MGSKASRGPPADGAGTIFQHTEREANMFRRAQSRRPSRAGADAAAPGPDAGLHDATTEDEERAGEPGATLYYPMYLMGWETLLGLPHMVDHQTMLKQGALTRWTAAMAGRVVLVSHEWLGFSHPDPAGEQLATLQEVLRRLRAGKVVTESDWAQQVVMKDNEVVTAKRWARVLPHCFFWLDYAGVPQTSAAAAAARLARADSGESLMSHHSSDHRFSCVFKHEAVADALNQQAMVDAVNSIPAYVERAAVVFVLAPVCKHQDDASRVCNFASWRGRGWCRVELFAALLSRSRVRLLRCIGPRAPLEFMFGNDAFYLPPGEGAFTCCSKGHLLHGRQIPCDRAHLRGVFERMLEASASYLGQLGMQDGRRLLICRREAFLRGLPPTRGRAGKTPPPPPRGGWVADAAAALHAFRSELLWSELDDARARAGQGWALLHWAAFAGNTAALRALLAGGGEQCALDARTPTGFPEFGMHRGFRALHLAGMSSDGSFSAAATLLSKANDADIAAGQCPSSLLNITASRGTAAHLAGLLGYFPECKLELHHRAYCGAAPLANAAWNGPSATPKLRLLLERGASARAGSGAHAVADVAIIYACLKEDSDPDAVVTLLQARCCPNAVTRPTWRRWSAIYLAARVCCRVRSACGLHVGPLTRLLAEAEGSTPLHAAARRGDVAVMAVLLEARADAARRNRMGRTPLQLARACFGGRAPDPVAALLGAA